jgi:hypothetical protein
MKDSIGEEVRNALREVEAGYRSLPLLDRGQLDQVWHALSCHRTDATPGYCEEEELRINYEGFCKVSCTSWACSCMHTWHPERAPNTEFTRHG